MDNTKATLVCVTNEGTVNSNCHTDCSPMDCRPIDNDDDD